MDLTLTEDQRAVQSAAREFLDHDGGLADAAAVVGSERGYSADLWEAMVTLGWTSLVLPESFGGLGGGIIDACLLAEELASKVTPTPFVPTTAAAWAIARFGTEVQRATLLPSVAEGSVITCAPGLTTTPATSVGARGQVSATRGPDGGIVIQGAVRFVPFIGAAEKVLVVAHDDRSGEELVAVVDSQTISQARGCQEAVGIEPLHDIWFDHVPVPARSVLRGPAAAALGRALTTLTCASMVGAAQGALDLTLRYAAQREQFGAPIGSFQAVQHHCANMAIDVLSSRLVTYEAAWAVDAEPGSQADVEATVSVAKAWSSEACERACSLGHQVHGAVGFTREHNLHWHLRHVLGCGIACGDADEHLSRLQNALGLGAGPS
jgi:alkylation response protein AidB-like acyl-CoA dehydrogenase